MKLRPLKNKDAPLMLEWMHDSDINNQFRFNAAEQTKQTTEDFITKALTDEANKHYAIVDKADEYMGTVSLKTISEADKTAEYAIVLRKKAQGQGYAKAATNAVLDIAFNKMGLRRVYLNVLAQNKKAISFYERFGFAYEGTFAKHVVLNDKPCDLAWYAIMKEDFKWQ